MSDICSFSITAVLHPILYHTGPRYGCALLYINTQLYCLTPIYARVPGNAHYSDIIMSVRDDVSNHQPHDCLLNRLFRHRSQKTLKIRVIGLCEGNSPATGEFPAQRASNAENVSIW